MAEIQYQEPHQSWEPLLQIRHFGGGGGDGGDGGGGGEEGAGFDTQGGPAQTGDPNTSDAGPGPTGSDGAMGAGTPNDLATANSFVANDFTDLGGNPTGFNSFGNLGISNPDTGGFLTSDGTNSNATAEGLMGGGIASGAGIGLGGLIGGSTDQTGGGVSLDGGGGGGGPPGGGPTGGGGGFVGPGSNDTSPGSNQTTGGDPQPIFPSSQGDTAGFFSNQQGAPSMGFGDQGGSVNSQGVWTNPLAPPGSTHPGVAINPGGFSGSNIGSVLAALTGGGGGQAGGGSAPGR